MKSYKGINIKERNDNRWYARFMKNNNKYTIYGKTQQICYDNLKEFLHNFKEPKQIKFEHTLKSWLDTWMKTYKANNKETTNTDMHSIINNYLNDLNNININEITTLTLQSKISSLSHKSSRQAQKLYTLCKDCFDKALKNNIIKTNPMLNIKKPSHITKEKQALTILEEKELISLLNNSIEDKAIYFMLLQGTRIGETLALTNKDIDINNKLININKSKNPKNKVTSPKNETSNRIIPLFDKTLNLIDLNNKLIFNSTYDKVQSRFQELRTLLNNDNLTIHSLRHTFTTRCIEKGLNKKVVSKWLGHSTTLITDKVYTHIQKDFEEEQIKLLNN